VTTGTWFRTSCLLDLVHAPSTLDLDFVSFNRLATAQSSELLMVIVGMPLASLMLAWCFAVLPFDRQVLTAGMSALNRSSCVPYAFGVSFMRVCSGTSIHGDFD